MTVEIVFDWSEGVDWDNLAHPNGDDQPPLFTFHNHLGKPDIAPNEFVDRLAGDTGDGDGATLEKEDRYSIIVVSIETTAPQTLWEGDDGWEFTEFDEDELGDPGGEWEDRDPSNMRDGEGVISFPGNEGFDKDPYSETEHVNHLATTADERDLGLEEEDTYLDCIKKALERPEDAYPDNGPLFMLAHPARYYWRHTQDWDRYVETFEQVSLDDGLIGIEAVNKTSIPNSGSDATVNRQDVELLDYLLTHFMPDRPVFGHGADDATRIDFGQRLAAVGRRQTWVLLQDDEFDPSQQHQTREAVVEKLKQGATLFGNRNQWEPAEGEESPDWAMIHDVEVDDGAATIEITAPDADEIRWISRRREVETGNQIDLEPDHIPYVRAEVINNPESVVYTQAWGLDGDYPGDQVRDANLGDVEFTGEL